MQATRNARITSYGEVNRQRQRSSSQTNLLDMAERRHTHSNLRRSSSITNLRTPRPTPGMRSPGIRTPSTIGLTSNSEQARRHANDNTQKVMEMIQLNRAFFNRLNIGNGGLKSMTSNQFIEIISFFMVKIAGKNLLSKSCPNNHENVIMTFIQALKYPYLVNKACFKTPGAHQHYPEVIAILAFLSDLVRDIKKSALPDMPLMPCDRLVNDDFTRLFSAEALRNYLSYDPDRDSLLDSEGEAKLVNGLIAFKMKIADLTVEKLAARTDQLLKSSKKIEQNLVKSESEKYFNAIEEQFAEKEKEHQKLQEMLTDKRKYLKMIRLTHEEHSVKLASKQAEIQNTMHTVQNQKYTTLDIKQLMAQETLIRSSIAMIQNEKDAIKAEADDAQVKLARLQKVKLDAIRKFNDFTLHAAQKLVRMPSFEQLNINNFTIDPTASVQTIQSICLRLKKLNENCVSLKRQQSNEIEQNKGKLTEYKTQYTQLTMKHDELMAQLQKAKQKFDSFNQKRSSCENKVSSTSERLQHEIDEKIAYKKQLEKQITDSREMETNLEAQNAQMLADGERQAQKIIGEKQKLCDQLDKFDHFMDEFEKPEQDP